MTVSGPPSRLKRILHDSESFSGRKVVKLPVHGGLCHAEHIYNQDHVRQIVYGPSENDSPKALETIVPCLPSLPTLSTSTGRPFTGRTATELLEQIIGEILMQRIVWDNVIQGVLDLVTTTAPSACQILTFCNSPPIHDLVAAFSDLERKVDMSIQDLVPSVFTTESLGPGITPRSPRQSKIAIVGMACRLPGGATNTEKFWDLLDKGLDVHRKIPADRFDVDTHCDPTGKRVNTSHTPFGCFIDQPGLFDAPFFNMSPREAQQTDPMQRLALVTAYEALERAGYVTNRTRATNLHRIGTFYGQASDDYREANIAQEISTYFIPGGCRAFGPGRINYFFKFSGPSFSCDTACSSSLATIQVSAGHAASSPLPPAVSNQEWNRVLTCVFTCRQPAPHSSTEIRIQ